MQATSKGSDQTARMHGLIRAGWSESLLVAHTTLLGISYRGSFIQWSRAFSAVLVEGILRNTHVKLWII